MRILRLASLGANLTGSYKKECSLFTFSSYANKTGWLQGEY